MSKTIRTVKYGNVPIVKDDSWCDKEVIDVIDIDSDTEWVEIKKSYNGYPVAIIRKEVI